MVLVFVRVFVEVVSCFFVVKTDVYFWSTRCVCGDVGGGVFLLFTWRVFLMFFSVVVVVGGV